MTDHRTHPAAMKSDDELAIVVDRAVRQTFATLGFDLETTADVRSMQADFNYMRKQRLGSEEVGKWVKKATISSLVAAALFALYQGVKFAFTMKGL